MTRKRWSRVCAACLSDSVRSYEHPQTHTFLPVALPGMRACGAGGVLSENNQSAYSSIVPVYAHMLGIRPAGVAQARTGERSVSRCEKTAQVSSVGWKRIRPRPINGKEPERTRNTIRMCPGKYITHDI